MASRQRQALIICIDQHQENQLKISHIVDFLHKKVSKGSKYSQTNFFAKKVFDAS
jgi:TRAP-type uncharacterized transport system substrate-binding protein